MPALTLDRLLASIGFGSRKECRALVRMGMVELDGVAVGVGGPGLPRVVGAELGVGDLDAAGAELGDGGGEVVDLEADVLVGAFGAVLGLAEEELDEGAVAGLV